MRSITTPGLSKELGRLLHDKLPVELVDGMVYGLLALIQEHLERGDSVSLFAVGTLHWDTHKATKKKLPDGRTADLPDRWVLKVRTTNLRRSEMEKYGVQLDDEKVKEAKITETGELCPQCGRPLDGPEPICSTCGTEPFEKKPEGGK
jgi:hypothetical protein